MKPSKYLSRLIQFMSKTVSVFWEQLFVPSDPITTTEVVRHQFKVVSYFVTFERTTILGTLRREGELNLVQYSGFKRKIP